MKFGKIFAGITALILCASAFTGCQSGGEQSGEAILFAIEVVTPPVRTEYTEGEYFDASGMVVEAVYLKDGAESRTDISLEVEIASDPLEAGQESVTVVYRNGNVVKTASVSVTVREEEKQEEEEPDYGTLSIEDMTLYNEFPSALLMISFSNPEYAEEIEYEYDSALVTIENDVAYLTETVASGKTVLVTARTEHHETVFRLYLKTSFSEHDAYVTLRENTLKGRRASGLYASGGVIFAGDSFFDPAFWTDFDTDYAGKNAVTVGIGGTRADEWTVFAERLLYPFAPSVVAFNMGTNDLGRGESAETVIAELEAMFLRVHANLPNARIVWYNITPRNDGSSPPSLDTICSVNEAVAAWGENAAWFTVLDAYSAFLGEDGTPDWSRFKDLLHPASSYYDSVYMALLEKAGISVPAI